MIRIKTEINTSKLIAIDASFEIELESKIIPKREATYNKFGILKTEGVEEHLRLDKWRNVFSKKDIYSYEKLKLDKDGNIIGVFKKASVTIWLMEGLKYYKYFNSNEEMEKFVQDLKDRTILSDPWFTLYFDE